MNKWLEDFLFSLDGFDFMVAAGLARGFSVRDLTRLLRCSTKTITETKQRVSEDLEEYQDGEGQEQEEEGEIEAIFREAGEGVSLHPLDRI